MSVAAAPRKTVTLPLAKVLELLVDANVTDQSRWPAGSEHGAILLARIREIEATCREQHGEWDWELLDRDTQDEYDNARCDLNEMIDDEPPIPWDEFKRSLENDER